VILTQIAWIPAENYPVNPLLTALQKMDRVMLAALHNFTFPYGKLAFAFQADPNHLFA